MKLLKSVFAAVIACAIVVCMSLCVLADSTDTYTVDIPDGFTKTEDGGQVNWKNDDGDIIIELAVSENTSNVKVNPNEAGQSYISLVEESVKSSLQEVEGVESEFVSAQSGLMELGEHDAIRVALVKKYCFEKGEMKVYRICYLFETQSYIHSVVVTSDEDVAEFADNLIKTFEIKDEAVALREDDTSVGSMIKGALLGALIGAAVGVVLALVKKLTDKKEAESKDNIPVDYREDDKKLDADEGFSVDSEEEPVAEDIFSIEENEELEETQVIEENV